MGSRLRRDPIRLGVNQACNCNDVCTRYGAQPRPLPAAGLLALAALAPSWRRQLGSPGVPAVFLPGYNVNLNFQCPNQHVLLMGYDAATEQITFDVKHRREGTFYLRIFAY